MGWRVCQGPKCTLPLLGFWLAASDQLAGQSLWGKKSWEKLLWRIPCKISLLRYFHRRSSSLSWELLGSCLSCTMAVFLPGWYPADGSPDPAAGSQFPVWTSGLPLHLGVAAPCCSFIVPARLGWGICPAVELCCSREWWMISPLLQEN